MNFKLPLLILLLGMLWSKPVLAQPMEFHLPQWPDTTIYLARYYGPQLYYIDTAQLVNGVVVFNGDKHSKGLFAVVMPNHDFFEVIHDTEAVVMTVGDTTDHMHSLTVQESANNKALLAYVRYVEEHDQKMAALSDAYRLAGGNPKKEAVISKKMRNLNRRLNAFRIKLIKQYEGLFVEQLIRLTLDVHLPPTPVDKNGVVTDSNYVYNYYIAHYWDGIDFKNPGLVHTPVFHRRLDIYFSDKGLVQVPDTITRYADWLLGQMDQQDQSDLVFQYSLNFITTKYQNVRIMGMDQVLVHLGKNYYCAPNNKAYWIKPDAVVRLCEQVRRTGNVLLGKKAIPLILTDSTEVNWINFYDLKSEYTVLYFWDPGCTHCQVNTPQLQTLYTQKFKPRNIEVYAVARATGDDFEAWKKFIRDHQLTFTNVGLTKAVYDQYMKDPRPLLTHTTSESLNYSDTYDVFSTPLILVLDKDKIIRYKQISISQLEQVMDELTGHAGDPKLFPEETE